MEWKTYPRDKRAEKINKNSQENKCQWPINI